MNTQTQTTPTDERDARELVSLAGQIHTWQTARNRTNAAMIREYPGLGSDKTYASLRDGRLDGYDIEAQLINYRSVWAVIEALSCVSGAEEAIYDDLGPVSHLRRAVLDVMRSTGTDRVVIVQGASGIGKTTALRILCGKYGARCIAIEAYAIWRDSASAMLEAILRALGQTDIPINPVPRLALVQELLGRSRRCVLIDEAHHCGPNCLNTLKALVNTTPGEFVLLAIPTLWSRLESNSYMEARQLSTNRLSERIKLDLTESDIVRYLRHTCPKCADETLKAAAKVIRPVALGSGCMAYVRDVAREVAKQSGDAIPDVASFSAAAATASRRR